MYKKIIEKLENKNIAILGFGKEGKSTYNFIRRYLKNQKITILDKNDILKLNPILNDDKNLKIIIGEHYLDNLEEYDLIIKAPGIALLNINIDSFKEKITSQLQLILEINKENIIGITGTKGKSTTSSLIFNILNDQRDNVFLLGNIGNPILDYIEEFNNMCNEVAYNKDELNEGLAFEDIYKQSNRKNCALLPYRGILKALEEYENK